MNTKLRYQQGQTIIEVLVASVIVSAVLTAIAVGLTFSVKTTADSRYRAFATKHAQETLEIFRKERTALGWETFYSSIGDGIYCLNDLPVDSTAFSTLTPGECGPGETIGDSIFTREADVTVTADAVVVVATVSWTDGAREKQVEVQGTFKDID